jgi:hypothetical protein
MTIKRSISKDEEILRKTLAVFYVITVLLIYTAYDYVNNQVINAFTIDASKSAVENPTSDMLNTKQDYNFRLVNTSDKAVKLMSIELQGFQGIKIGTLTVLGKSIVEQEVKSNRMYSSPKSWSTNSQGLIVEYLVEIIEPKIQNPTSALITYSYLGIKHKQVVDFPGIRKAGTTTLLSSPLINFHVSIISSVIAIVLLIVIYINREVEEAYLGIKLFGYYYIGAFNLNINILIPLGIIICLFLFHPKINAKVKMYSAISGYTFMILSYLFPSLLIV